MLSYGWAIVADAGPTSRYTAHAVSLYCAQPIDMDPALTITSEHFRYIYFAMMFMVINIAPSQTRKKKFLMAVVLVVNCCFTSLFGTNGHSSDIVIDKKQSYDEMNDIQMMM